MAAPSGSRRVVIVGGGFAGLFAARRLGRAPVQVTFIDRAEHHLFQPLLYQCATGILSEGKIAAPLRELMAEHRNVEFVLAQVTGIDAAARKVVVRRPLGEEIEFGYDYLILAAGVRQSYFGHDGGSPSPATCAANAPSPSTTPPCHPACTHTPTKATRAIRPVPPRDAHANFAPRDAHANLNERQGHK